MSFDKEDKHDQHEKQNSSDRQISSAHNTVNMAGKDGQMDVGRQSHDQTLQMNGNNMEFHPVGNNSLHDILPELNRNQLGGKQNSVEVFYVSEGGGEGKGHGKGHDKGSEVVVSSNGQVEVIQGKGNDKNSEVVVGKDGQVEVLHGEKAREAAAIQQAAANGQLDTKHMSKEQIDNAVKEGLITQQQANAAEGKTGTDSNSSDSTKPQDTNVKDSAPTEVHGLVDGQLATGQDLEKTKEMVRDLLDKISNFNAQVEGISDMFSGGWGRDFSGNRQLGGRDFSGPQALDQHQTGGGVGGDGQGLPSGSGSSSGSGSKPGGDGFGSSSSASNGGDVPPVVPVGVIGGDGLSPTTTANGTRPGDSTSGITNPLSGDNTGSGTTPGDNTGGSQTANPNSAAARAAANLVVSDGSVDPAIVNDVKQTIMNSPQGIIDALNSDKPQIMVTNASLGGGAGAYFDEASNQVVISGDKNNSKQLTEQELKQVWNYVNNTNGSQVAQQDLSKVSPDQIG